jgi:hypothetical protein
MTFYEIIDSLIDVTGVPKCQQKGEGYESARKSIHDEFATVEDVEIGCYHEAGHWAFAVLVANQLGVDGSLFDVVGPRIKYDAKTNLYDATPTGLSLPGMENRKAQNESEVMAMARIAVAGGEAVHHFYGPNQNRGDKDDRDRFKVYSKEARLWLGGPIDPPHVYWNKAIEDARGIDFKDALFALRVSQKAELVKEQQFGPVFRSHT